MILVCCLKSISTQRLDGKMNILRLLDRLECQVKHMPGRHNQKLHDPHKGPGGNAVSYEWFHDGGSHLVSSLDPAYADVVIESLVNYGVSREDLDGLNGFTIAAPNGYVAFTAMDLGLDPKEYGYGSTIWRDDGSEYMNGVYDPGTRMVCISESKLASSEAHKTILHEVGHHVSMRSDARRSHRYGQSVRILSELERLTEGDAEKLSKYGLRQYSLTKGLELMADVYMVDKTGSVTQKERLRALLRSMDIDDIEHAYKMYGNGFTYAREIIGIQHRDMVEFLTREVVLDIELLNSTPWYYEK